MAQTEAPAELPARRTLRPAAARSIKLIAALLLLTLVAAGLGGGLGVQLAKQVEDAVRVKKDSAEAETHGQRRTTQVRRT